MTKKTFVLVANAIHEVLDNFDDSQVARNVLTELSENLAVEFRRKNPLFDQQRFLRACGLIP
jgi:hypothetical protein